MLLDEIAFAVRSDLGGKTLQQACKLCAVGLITLVATDEPRSGREISDRAACLRQVDVVGAGPAWQMLDAARNAPATCPGG